MHSLPSMTETTTTVTAIDETIRISVSGEIASTPEQVLAATVDFSERRERVFPAVSMSRMTLHSLGATTADATEGTRGARTTGRSRGRSAQSSLTQTSTRFPAACGNSPQRVLRLGAVW